jgi:hypothetical protein
MCLTTAMKANTAKHKTTVQEISYEIQQQQQQ